MIFFELLDVAVLDLPHEGCALEKVALEIGESWRGTTKNWLWSTSEKKRGARRYEMGAPLEDEAGVPCNQEKNERGPRPRRRAAVNGELGEPLEQKRQAEDEDGG